MSSKTISIHPLSLLDVSDYYTRTIASRRTLNSRILIGGLLGRNNSITHAFEILVNDNGIVTEFLEQKLEQLKIIYPAHTFIGFYQVSSDPALNPDPLVVQLLASTSLHLPTEVNGMVYMIVNPEKIQQGPLIKILALSDLETQLLYKFEATPSEKASLNSITESLIKPKAIKSSEHFTATTSALQNSLQNLDLRLGKVVKYLKNVELPNYNDADDNNEDYEDEKDIMMSEIDRFLLELDIIRKNGDFKTQLLDEELQLLMSTVSHLMVFLNHK